MTRLEIFNILHPIVKRVTGVPTVILADQVTSNGSSVPAPTGAYAVIEPKQTINQRGQANIHLATAAEPQAVGVDVRAQILVDVSINFYRGQARDLAERLLQCSKRPDVFADLHKAKLGWMREGAVNNLTALQSNNYEQRGQITLTLAYETTDATVINSVESASYEVQYEDGTVVATGDIVE